MKILKPLCIFFITTSVVQAKSFDLRLDPINILLGEYGGTFHVALHEKFSVGIGGKYINSDTKIKEFSAEGQAFRSQLFYYVNNMNKSGIHITSGVELYDFKIWPKDMKETLTIDAKVLTVPWALGWRQVFENGINVSFSIGIQYMIINEIKINLNISNDIMSIVLQKTLEDDIAGVERFALATIGYMF